MPPFRAFARDQKSHTFCTTEWIGDRRVDWRSILDVSRDRFRRTLRLCEDAGWAHRKAHLQRLRFSDDWKLSTCTVTFAII